MTSTYETENINSEIKHLFINKLPINSDKYLYCINNLNTTSLDLIISNVSTYIEFEKILDKIDIRKINSSSTFYCIISSYVKFGKIDKAKEIIDIMYVRRYPLTNRHIDCYLDYFYNRLDNFGYDCIEWLFNYIIVNKIIVTSNLIIKFLIYFKKHNYKIILDNMDYLILNFNSEKLDSKYLHYLKQDNSYLTMIDVIDISYKQKTYMKQNIFLKNNIKKDSRFINFVEFIDKNNFNIIIDGANLGYYKNSHPLNQKNIDSCYNYYKNKGFEPLIILHERHRNNYPLMKKWIFNKCIYFTNYGMNDDCFWLMASLKNENNKVITNDNIKDHITKFIGNTSNTTTYLDIYKNKYIINYQFNNQYKFIPCKAPKYNHTIYFLSEEIIGFPKNNNFYVL